MQTKNALDNHYVEGNPFLGKYPSSDRILLQKILSAGVVYCSFNKLDEERRRKGLLIVNGIQWGVVIKNESIGDKNTYSSITNIFIYLESISISILRVERV
jgi:hypothetical protein